MRQKILDAATKLGYVGPDPAARALARGTTGAIGILLTSSLRYAFDDDVATGFMGAIAGELAPRPGPHPALVTAVGDMVPARDVPMDAALVYSCDPAMTARRLARPPRPAHRLRGPGAGAGITSVNVDDRGGARAAAQHVVDLGHTRVGVMIAALGGAVGYLDDPVEDSKQTKFISRSGCSATSTC